LKGLAGLFLVGVPGPASHLGPIQDRLMPTDDLGRFGSQDAACELHGRRGAGRLDLARMVHPAGRSITLGHHPLLGPNVNAIDLSPRAA